MNRQKVLNGIGVIWFVINFPIFPFVGSLMDGFTQASFSNARIASFAITFIVFSIVLSLSKMWLGKFIKAPVILSLIPFLFATLQLPTVQDFLVKHRPLLLWGIFIVLVVVICVAVVKAMRGELNEKI